MHRLGLDSSNLIGALLTSNAHKRRSTMPLMPVTGQFNDNSGQDQFQHAFSERAWNLFTRKHSDLAENVATFKIIESDVNTGRAVGAFLLMLGKNPVYVPVVLVDGEIRPLMFAYSKTSDQFFPLNAEWLDVLERSSMGGIGQPAHRPIAAEGDVRLNNLTRPPNLMGRFSYASDGQDRDGLAVLEALPNGVKTAFLREIGKEASRMERLVQEYGYENLKSALAKRIEKTAAKEVDENVKRDLVIFKGKPSSVDLSKFKGVFGDRAAKKLHDLRAQGYAISDNRATEDLLVASRVELGANFEQIKEPGFYQVLSLSGDLIPVFATQRGGQGELKYTQDDPEMSVNAYRPTTPRPRSGSSPRISLIDKDCMELSECHTVMGIRVKPAIMEGSKLMKALEGDAMPKAGQVGYFVWRTRSGNRTSLRVSVKSVFDRGGAKFVLTHTGHNVVLDPEVPVMSPNRVNGRLVYLPPNAKWVRTEPKRDLELAVAPAQIERLLALAMREQGGRRLKVVKTTGNDFSVDGNLSLSRLATVTSLAKDYKIEADKAEEIVKEASEKGLSERWLRPRVKIALPVGAQGQMDPAMMQQMQMQGQMDPAMMQQMQMQGQMDPAMMQQIGMGMPQEQIPVSNEDETTINPQLLDVVNQAGLEDPGLIDMAVISALSSVPQMEGLVGRVTPAVKRALDGIARITISVWIHSDKVKESIGDKVYTSLDDALTQSFKSLGECLLLLDSDVLDVGDK